MLMEHIPASWKVMIFFPVILLVSCNRAPEPSGTPFQTTVHHPSWSKRAVLYEVNIRQYTPEGTFRAFEQHLPRLKELGVDILWLMPVYPIGEKNRKGPLGSYYSVKDYTAVNPEFGTLDDLKHLVDKAHDMGFHVLFDWVANHTAWDNPWLTEHPEWYEHDSAGHFVSPYDWTDVVQLDYHNHHLWNAMTDAMKFWVTQAGIDGFRCDYPGRIPVAFWDSVRTVLEKVRPVFMLAEDEEHTALLEHAFDMNYAWEFLHLTEHIAQGKEKASALTAYFDRQATIYPPQAYRLNCITNHDENSWNGTIGERYGSAAKTFAALSFTVPGMPLIYSGQEAGLNKRLRFFERDTIFWKDTAAWSPFYRQLIRLKHSQKALWNGTSGSRIHTLQNSEPEKVFSFYREKGDSRVIFIGNLTSGVTEVKIYCPDIPGSYSDHFTGTFLSVTDTLSLNLGGWEYLLLTNGEH